MGSQFQISDDESESESESENEIVYGEFIAQFLTLSESENESNSESESESSEISIEEVEAFPDEVEEHILPVIEPRPMVANISCDSNLSEDTVNLWNFNAGFHIFDFDDEGEDIFAPLPLMHQASSQPELVVN